MLIDAHVHLDKYGDRLDDALTEIEERTDLHRRHGDGRAVLSGAARDRQALRISSCRPSASIRAAPPNMPTGCPRSAVTSNRAPPSARSASTFTGSKTRRLIRRNEKSWNISSPPPPSRTNSSTCTPKPAKKKSSIYWKSTTCSRAIIHWYSGPMDILRAMIDYGCYFTIGVEVLYSDYIKDNRQSSAGSSAANRNRQPRRTEMVEEK